MPKRTLTFLSLGVLLLGQTGCSPAPNATPTASANVSRTIQMADASLFVSGDNWVYTYPTGTGKFHVVGHNVEFVERKDTQLLVKLGDSVEANIPISGKNLFVDASGVHDISIDLTDVEVNEEMIKTVVEPFN